VGDAAVKKLEIQQKIKGDAAVKKLEMQRYIVGDAAAIIWECSG